MLLKAAINGGENEPEVPKTPEEIAQAAAAAIEAGANVVHAHARDTSGAETIDPEHIGAMVRAVKAVNPDIVIGTTTGLWTTTSHEQRLKHVTNWPQDALPDFASVAFNEEGANEAAELVVARGMDLESAVWSWDDVPALLASTTLHQNIRVLIEPETEDVDQALRECREIAAHLVEAGVTAPILYHGFDESVWPIVQAAIDDGCETRIGFEDGNQLPNGETAANNVQLIKAVRELEKVPAR